MRIDHAEVQFAGDEKDDRADSGHTFESSSAAFGGLEQTVESFQEAIGLPGLRPGNDAIEMRTYEGGDFLHRLDLGAHDARAPALQHGAHDIDLVALQDLAQLFLV